MYRNFPCGDSEDKNVCSHFLITIKANWSSAVDPHAHALRRLCAAAQVGSFSSSLSSACAVSSVGEPQANCAGNAALATPSRKAAIADCNIPRFREIECRAIAEGMRIAPFYPRTTAFRERCAKLFAVLPAKVRENRADGIWR